MHVGMDAEDLLRLKASSTLFASELSGGAFVANVSIEGRSFKLTVDTGSALTISLGLEAVKKLRSCEKSHPMHVQQQGVNGERVCSSIVWCKADVAGRSLKTPVFLNDHNIEQVDGYIGLGIIKCFDMIITKQEMRLRFVEDDLSTREKLTDASRSGWCTMAPRCGEKTT